MAAIGNSVMKAGFALSLGSSVLRRQVALVLGLTILVGAASLWLVR
jgi:type IV secretory pathway VirB2 component (pilin)